MSNPKITMQLIDPGSLVQPASVEQTPIFAGVCSSGTEFEMREFTNEENLVAWGGHGHLIDVARVALATMASVKVMRVPASTAGVFEAESTDDPLTTDAFTGSPLHFLRGTITIAEGSTGLISGGSVKVRISLDAWDIPHVTPSQSAVIAVPADGVVALPGVGLTITLTPGQTPDVGDSLTFIATPGHPDATAIASAFDAAILPESGECTALCITGDVASAAGANTLAGGAATKLAALFAKARFLGALMGAGLETAAAAASSFANTVSAPPFLSAGFGLGYSNLPKPTSGRSRVALCEHDLAAIRIAGSLVSSDPGRTASGALVSVVGVSYDAAIEGSVLEEARLSSLRNWHPDAEGYFITRQRMLSPTGSNYVSWQFAALIIIALRITHRACFRLILETLRRTATSTIDPRDASDIEESANTDLRAALLEPRNARGTQGHVSAIAAKVDLTTVLPNLEIDVRIRPHGYPTDIVARMQYAGAV